jgi:hypothetical protein
MKKLRQPLFILALVFLAFLAVFSVQKQVFSSAAHTGGNIIAGASSASLTASAVCPPTGGVCSGTLTSQIGIRMPYSATLNQLFAYQATAPASGSSCSFTVRVSPSCTGTYNSTALACTITGNGSAKTCQNTSSSSTVNAGDCVQILFTEVGTCNGFVNWGLEAY